MWVYVYKTVCPRRVCSARHRCVTGDIVLSLLTTYRKPYMGFSNNHYWISKIQDGGFQPSWKSAWRHFFLPRVVRWYRMTCQLRWCVEIPIWRTFGRIRWHVVSHCMVLPPGEFRSYLSHCRVLPLGELGEFNVVIVPHCMVLPLSEYDGTIPELPATLQSERIPSVI